MRLSAGSEVNEWLRLVRPLGQGGMGAVWACEDRKRGCEVAVKFVLARHVRDDPELVARFRRETEVAARIHSPHVIRGFESGETDDGIPYLVMELLDGETLADRLDRERYVELAETVPIVLQIAHALGAAHELGLVHRDIKPENVFLVHAPELQLPLVKVLDFGTVKRTLERDESIVTATGVMVGTPEYMSPEQVLGSRGVDHRADLWALGVVAYEMLVGGEPFRGNNPQALCLAICTATYTPLHERLPELPAALDGWFARAFARSPADRYSSAAEMAAELTRITGIDLKVDADEGPAAPPEPEVRPALTRLVDDVPAEAEPRMLEEEPTRQLEGRSLLAATRGVFAARAAPTSGYGDEPVTRVKLDSLPSIDPLRGVPDLPDPDELATRTGGERRGPMAFDDEPTRQAFPVDMMVGQDGEQPTARHRPATSQRSASRSSRSRSSADVSRERSGDGRSATRGSSGPRAAASRSGRSGSRPSQRRRRGSSVARRRRTRLLVVLAALFGVAVALVAVAVLEVRRPHAPGARQGGETNAAASEPPDAPPTPGTVPAAGAPPAPHPTDPNGGAAGVGGAVAGGLVAGGAGQAPDASTASPDDASTGDAGYGASPNRNGRRSGSTRPRPYAGRDAGYLSVECEPGCDEVVVGDTAIGPTPIEKYALRPGAYRVELLAGSQPTQVITVKIRPGHTTTRLVLME